MSRGNESSDGCYVTVWHVTWVQSLMLQPVPEKMRLEMLVKTQIEILDGQSSYIFSNEPFEKRPGMTIEDLGLHSDYHFESRLLGNGLYVMSNAGASFSEISQVADVTFDLAALSSAMMCSNESLWCVVMSHGTYEWVVSHRHQSHHTTSGGDRTWHNYGC